MIKALIIDDEKWSRRIIKNFGKWDTLGIEIVAEAEDGEQALELIEEANPDIIITDMNMPNLDGVRLLQEVRQRRLKSRIIIISGHDDFEYLQQAIRSHAFEYILKPIDPQELNQVLDRCVQEICVKGNGDRFAIYQRFESETLNHVAIKIKELKGFIQERDLLHIEETIDNIYDFFIEHQEKETVIIALLDNYLTPLLREEIFIPFKEKDSIRSQYKRIREVIESTTRLRQYLDEIYKLFEIFIFLEKQLIEQEEKSIPILAKEYIDSVYKQEISLKKVAKHLFASKEYLSAAFKNNYNVTVSQYILGLKMKEAVKLLSKGLKNKQIAEELSYHNVTYFYKVFKKYYGCTPGEYKNKLEG